ncbi:hypothetical protein [uncultured Clostridium sp.]|uniref:hypothetical protein n=1 Tax=uncultured Clostridium sp. TaxID=59620 RepID=UPI0028E813AD|nr:hypothetical protein [uncultured Clostridium sp.]
MKIRREKQTQNLYALIEVIIIHPGGCYVMECCIEGAIRLRHPLMNEVHWVEKEKLINKQNY